MWFPVKRFIDLILTCIAVIFSLLLFIIIAFLVKLTSKGPILHWSDRVGKRNVVFSMPKFRSMNVNTPILATHLLDDPKSVLTPIGEIFT